MLEQMNREQKVRLIKDIQAGNLKVGELPKAKPALTFTAIGGDLFKGEESGETLTFDQVMNLNRDRSKHLCWWEKYNTVRAQNGAIERIELGEISTFEQMNPMSEDELKEAFLAMMKKGSQA